MAASQGDVAALVVVGFGLIECRAEALGYEVVFDICVLDSDGLWPLAKGPPTQVAA